MRVAIYCVAVALSLLAAGCAGIAALGWAAACVLRAVLEVFCG